jgi:hypothetical protein
MVDVKPSGVEGVGAGCVAQASCGVGGEVLGVLQVRGDGAPGRPTVPSSCGELAKVVGNLRQVPDQCEGFLASGGHRQGSRSGERRRCRFNRSVDREFHHYIATRVWFELSHYLREWVFRQVDTPLRPWIEDPHHIW